MTTPAGAGGEDRKVWVNVEDVIGDTGYPNDLVVSVKLGDLRGALRAGSAPPAAPVSLDSLMWRIADVVEDRSGLTRRQSEDIAREALRIARRAAPPAAPDGQRTRPPSHGSGPSAARCTDPDCTLPHPGRAAPDGERRAVRGDEAERARNALIGAMDPDLRYGYCIGLLDDFESALRSASPQNPEAE